MPKHDCNVHRFLLYKNNVLWKLLPYHYLPLKLLLNNADLPLKLLLNNADPLSYEERSMAIPSQFLMTWIVKEKFKYICLNEIYLVILYTLAATNQFAIDIVAATLYLDDTPKRIEASDVLWRWELPFQGGFHHLIQKWRPSHRTPYAVNFGVSK